MSSPAKKYAAVVQSAVKLQIKTTGDNIHLLCRQTCAIEELLIAGKGSVLKKAFVVSCAGPLMILRGRMSGHEYGKTSLSGHDVTYCDYHKPFCCWRSRSI